MEKSANLLCVGMGWFPVTPGGLNRYLYEFAQTLAQGQDQVKVLGVGTPDESFGQTSEVLNLASPSQSMPARLWQTRQSFAQQDLSQVDAINLHFALYSFPLMDLLPKDIPVTFSFHGPWADECRQEGAGATDAFLKQQLETYVYRRCDRFIVLSQAFGQILHGTYGIPWEKIAVIPGGVNIEHFAPRMERSQARAKLGFPQDRPILFTPRRLVHRMGLDRLIQAIQQVKQQVPDVWLAIAGKGPLKEALTAQVKALGLEDHVQLLGYVPDEQLPLCYEAADLTVVPSLSLEGFGLILLESLASGTPVLSTPVGGMPEILRPFVPHLVTDSTEVKDIADRITQLLLGHCELPGRAQCRDYAITHYDWAKIGQQVRDRLLVKK
jgi:glycosyltransferase involved in cell wall biosynthesis